MSCKLSRRNRIKRGTRRCLAGSAERPRLSVYRSNTAIYAQIIDDVHGRTLVAASSLKELPTKGNKIEQSLRVGKLLADKAIAMGIKKIVFDRNGYLYHGRVKALAMGARESGLVF